MYIKTHSHPVVWVSFEIKIEGLDELERELKKIKGGLSLPILKKWCRKISNEARINSPEGLGEEIQLDAIKTGLNKFDIKFKAPKEAIPYIKSSIRRNLTQMPITTRGLFEQLLKQIEQREK